MFFQPNSLAGGYGYTGPQNALQSAQINQAASSTQNQVAQTGAQMFAETQKTMAQIRQIRQETMTKVQEMFRDSMLNRVKSASKIHDKWVQTVMA